MKKSKEPSRCLSLCFAFDRYRLEDPSRMAWSSPVACWTLTTPIFALPPAGRPFTASCAGKAGFPPLHRAPSVMRGGLHSMCY